jgi:hypothetical protein
LHARIAANDFSVRSIVVFNVQSSGRPHLALWAENSVPRYFHKLRQSKIASLMTRVSGFGIPETYEVKYRTLHAASSKFVAATIGGPIDQESGAGGGT